VADLPVAIFIDIELQGLQFYHVPVWYVVAKDEGHGFQKKVNADYLRTVSIVFLETYLLGKPPQTGATAAPGGR